jgi:hypothetical protein
LLAGEGAAGEDEDALVGRVAALAFVDCLVDEERIEEANRVATSDGHGAAIEVVVFRLGSVQPPGVDAERKQASAHIVPIELGGFGIEEIHPLGPRDEQVFLLELFADGRGRVDARPHRKHEVCVVSVNLLQLRAQKQYEHGLQFIANFTYSHTLDNGTGSGYGGAGAEGSLWQDGYDPYTSYGNSLLDIPITFNGDVIYDLPAGQGRIFLNHGGVLNGIIGGWQASGLFQVHSGTPFTPYLPVNNSGSLSGTWFPNRVGSGRVAHPTISSWFNAADFVQPAFGTYGDSGRNILFGPSWRQLDVSLSKHWKLGLLGDLGDAQVRVDASDVLNHPNFSNPDSAIGTPGVGIITGANTSRSLQFAGKLTF